MLLFLKNFLFTVFVPGSVAVFIPYRIVVRADPGLVFAPWRLLWSAPLFLLGAGIYFWCLWNFAVTGRGTPAPIDPPKRLVVRGLYRRVRNPMYLGILLVLSGEALFFRSRALLGYAGLVFLFFFLFVVAYEEPALTRKFGQDYERYCDSVPRWIPRLRVDPE